MMDHKAKRLRLLRLTVLSLMSRIEKAGPRCPKHGVLQCLQDFEPQLETRCREVMDKDKPGPYNVLIRDMEERLFQYENKLVVAK